MPARSSEMPDQIFATKLELHPKESKKPETTKLLLTLLLEKISPCLFNLLRRMPNGGSSGKLVRDQLK
jgi:hypothetical protein